MKTLTELNEKIWFRAVKVIYIIFFVCAALSALGKTITSSFGDNSKFRQVMCLGGNNTVFDAEFVSSYYGGLQEDKVIEACQIPIDEIQNTVKVTNYAKSFKNVVTPKIELSSFYTIRPAIQTQRGWANFFVFLFLQIAIIFCFFVLGRGLFYYIVLGRFNPQK